MAKMTYEAVLEDPTRVRVLMNRHMTCQQIAVELGCTPREAHDLVIAWWRGGSKI